jgi:hypothetical protein
MGAKMGKQYRFDDRSPRYYVDRAGTIPAKPGDPVGCVVFGDGTSKVAQSDPARPTLTNDGGVLFDEIDDDLISED